MKFGRLASACATVLCSLPLSSQLCAAQSTQAAGKVSFNVYLPVQNRAALETLLTQQQTQGTAEYHKWLTPAEFNTKFGLSATKIKAIESELSGFGLTITSASPRQLRVSGTAAQVQAALGTALHPQVLASGKRAMVATAAMNPPSSLAAVGAKVVGLDTRQRVHTHSHIVPQNRYSQAGGYWFDDLKQAYTWPSYKVVKGTGVNIGILMTGDILMSDMDLYFSHEKLPTPSIHVEEVLGGAPFDPNGGSFESQLDIQQSAGMAPGADVLLYNIPDLSDESIIVGLLTIDEENTVDVVNMSFGGAELDYTAEYNGGMDYTFLNEIEDELFMQGNAQGITFVASSGDSGALSIPSTSCLTSTAIPCGNFVASAEFPASSPHVTAVGGTNLGTVTHPRNPNNLDSAYLYEEAFADPLAYDIDYGTSAVGSYWGSGGGDSILFKKPDYQKLIATGSKVRAVPDIALHMGGCPGAGDPTCTPEDSYDIEALAGGFVGVIGTSASSPDFAGLTALNIELQGSRLGNENYYIYALAAAQKAGTLQDIYHQRIPGFNGLYTSGNEGYNRVLGVGTPYGKNFLLIPNKAAAGKPQTPSNP